MNKIYEFVGKTVLKGTVSLIGVFGIYLIGYLNGHYDTLGVYKEDDKNSED